MSGKTRYTKQYSVEIRPDQQRYGFMERWRAKDIVKRSTHFKSSDGKDYYAWGEIACEIRKDEEGWFFWFVNPPIDHGTLLIEVKEDPHK